MTQKLGCREDNMHFSVEKIWQSAQEHLRSKLGKDTYNMWFAPLRACDMDASHVILETPNEFSEVWLKDNYLSLLQDAVAVAAGRQLQVKFKIASAQPIPAPAAPAPTAQTLPAKPKAEAHERATNH